MIQRNINPKPRFVTLTTIIKSYVEVSLSFDTRYFLLNFIC